LVCHTKPLGPFAVILKDLGGDKNNVQVIIERATTHKDKIKLSTNCQQVVKQLSKSCQKLSKSCQKVVKKLSQSRKKVVKKMKKVVKKLSNICSNFVTLGRGPVEKKKKLKIGGS
jgi:uncharacterized protein YoxC